MTATTIFDATGCPLSARELAIVALAADGATNIAIGSTLGLSPHTVKTHLARISVKLGTDGRAHMVAVGFRSGWLR